MPPFRALARLCAIGGASLVALALAGCSRNLDLPSPKPPTIPFVSITSISPSTLRADAVATITFAGSTASTSCSASVGGQLASCTFTPPSWCSCTFTVGGTVPEGTLLVTATMGNAVGNGLAIGVVVVDKTAPTVDPASVTVTRRACGADDAVTGAAGSASDGGVPYAERHVATVRIWAAAAGGEPLLSLSPSADGSFAQVDLPATGGAASPAPATYHASAVDAAGNESARVPLPSGALTSPPAIDPVLSVIVDRGSAATGVMGEAGAIGPVATLCGARPTAIDGTPIGPALSPAGDGSFPEVTLTAGGPGTVYLRAWDKAGNVGGPTKVRTVEAATSPGGRAAYAPDLGAALFARGADASPSTVPPAQGPLLAGEVADVEADKAAAVDAASFVVTATSETSTVAAQWATFASQPMGGGYAAYDTARQKTVYLASNGTFENDGTSWTRAGNLPFSSPTQVVYHAASGGVVTMTTGPSAAMQKWNGSSWSTVSPAARPTSYGRIATDTGRNRIVFYDGTTTTWEFDATNWTSISTAAYATPAVSAPILAYNAAGANPGLVLYGGYDVSYAYRTETWRWTGTRWMQVTTANNPGSCSTAGAAYHAGLGRLMLVGDQTGTGYCGAHRAGWLYDGSDWVQVASTVGPPDGSRAIAYDAARGRLVSASADTWVFGSAWQEQTPRLPSAIAARLAWDPRRSAMTYVDAARRTWTVGAGGSWTPTSIGAPPDVRSVLYDPARGGLVAFERTTAGGGGWRAWRLDGSTWSEDPSATIGLPAADDDLAFVADPMRGLIVAVGTRAWEYDGSAWTDRGATGFYDQYTQVGPFVFFDPGRGRVIASGGYWDDGEAGGEYRTVWEWNGTAWSARAIDNAYNGLSTATFDANFAQGRTISTDGSGASVQFDGTRWTALGGVSGTPVNAGVAYDPVRSVTVGLTTSRAATELTTRQPHARHAAVETLFRFPSTASLGTATARLVGAGRGASGGVATYGVQLLAWSWTTWSWTSLGTHAAGENAAAATRTISAALTPADHVRGGRVWLLAVPSYASSASPAIPSLLWIDTIELSARYVLPP